MVDFSFVGWHQSKQPHCYLVIAGPQVIIILFDFPHNMYLMMCMHILCDLKSRAIFKYCLT